MDFAKILRNVGQFLRILWRCSWPLAISIALYLFMHSQLGDSNFFHVDSWPGTLANDGCPLKPKDCNRISELDHFIRVFAFCGAVFPLLNYVDHFDHINGRKTRNAGQRRKNSWSDTTVETVRSFAEWAVVAAIILNVAWIGSITLRPLNTGAPLCDEIAIVMFLFLCVSDILGMILNHFGENKSDIKEFRYLYGCLVFIDIPTLVGLLLLEFLAYRHIDSSIVSKWSLISEAFLGGSFIMHISVSQIGLIGLKLQREIS